MHTSTVLPLIGADPEVFLKIKGTDVFIPSLDLIGGSKDDPLPVDKGALQEDNVTAEFNINPSADPEEFSDNIQHVMRQLQEKVGGGIELVIQSSASFDSQFLDDPRARAIGCDPDYNAYSTRQNHYSVNYDASTVRYAGGHIHIGHDMVLQRPKDSLNLVKLMDWHVGTFLATMDEDTERSKHYGKAGNYRPKPYGIEYRTASNYWLNSAELMRDVHRLSQRAFFLWKIGVMDTPEELEQAVNEKNHAVLYKIMPEVTKHILRKYS